MISRAQGWPAETQFSMNVPDAKIFGGRPDWTRNMIGTVPAGHPKETLFFFVASGLDQTIRTEMRNFVHGLANVATWTLGPPVFVDECEEAHEIRGGDLPIETVGGFLQIYTASPPWCLAREIDLRHLHEVETLVTRLRHFFAQRRAGD